MSSKTSLACAGAFAAAATFAGPAFAAEPAPTPPPPPVPIFTWTGLYIGGQIGYAWGKDPVSWSGISNDDELAAGTFGNSPQGVIGGGHVGYNFQYNPWLVFGVEGNVDGTSLSHTAAVAVNDIVGDTPGSITSTCKAGVQHPTIKPVRLYAEILKDCTRPQDIALDCFGGSGTILLAAEQLGRGHA